MKPNLKTTLGTLFAAGMVASLIVACGGGGGGASDEGGGSQTNYTISGSVASTMVMSLRGQGAQRAMFTSTITHVMAAAATGEVFVGAVNTDGSFSLGISAGVPYTFVFIDENQVGENMIVGILKPDAGSTGLDTLIPAAAGAADLGQVSIDGATEVASMTTTLSDFLTAMGVDNSVATTIGGVDDLTLRMANPDKNADGEIDYYQNLGDIRMDIHVRSSTACTSDCNQGYLRINGFDGAYITDVPGFVLSPSLTSIYAVYQQAFDSNSISTWVASSGVSSTLSGGATYQADDMAGGATADIKAHATFSGDSTGDYLQWGPDYALDTGGVELPGYDTSVKLTYSFNSKTLSFPYFRSRPKDDLFGLIPDFKLNTSGGVITSLDYRWMKWTGSAWAAATDVEVGLLVSGDSAAFGLYTQKGSGVEEGITVRIPTTSAAGNIPWTAANVEKSAGVTKAVEAMAITDFCSGTSSYEDKIGLRIFAHSFGPAASGGPSHCP